MRTCLGLVACVLLLGCASAPPVIDYAQIETLRPMFTTKADVVALFGEPTSVRPLPEGQEEWLYLFSPQPLESPGGDLPEPTDRHRAREMLRVVFLPSGLVFRQEVTRSGINGGAAAVGQRAQLGISR